MNTFKVAYSSDGQIFSYVVNRNNQVETFKGPHDPKSSVVRMFEVPIEAKTVKIYPITWHLSPALKLELLGCSILSTEVTPTTETTPYCMDEMGVNNGMMADAQISVTSELNSNHDKEHLKLDSTTGWRPLTNSPFEWLQV